MEDPGFYIIKADPFYISEVKSGNRVRSLADIAMDRHSMRLRNDVVFDTSFHSLFREKYWEIHIRVSTERVEVVLSI